MRRLALSAGSLLLLATLTGCPTVPEEDARAAIQQAFEAANPPGRVGAEVRGKSVWLTATMFQEECLHDNDLAFSDDAKKRPRGSKGLRISPTYKNQRFITDFTEDGWCIYQGSDPRIDIREGTWEGDHWDFFVMSSFAESSPWAQCLDYNVLNRQIQVVRGDDGSAVVKGELALFQDACPQPLPGGEERRSAVRPTTKPSSPPSLAQVNTLLGAFDQALFDRDFQKALGMVSCYNVFEEQRYGTCSVAELINLAPLPRGGVARPEDGPPWSMNVFDSLDAMKRVFADRDDPSLFHVEITPRKGKPRSLAVQWVAGEWKLVGVVGLKAEDLTMMQIVYDLDRKEKREIFERRMLGEPIDAKGHPYDPYAEYKTEE
jgi:hypothetical protein